MPASKLVGYFTPGSVRWARSWATWTSRPDPTRTQVVDTVRTAFGGYVHGAEVRFTSACRLVSARASVGSETPTTPVELG